ncbi:Hypothetical protein NTJ_11561 [Nesidiocoris tenuis]|uniref:Lipid-binding serum glycoprotein N-terminal domain-containing protein n=1 Tax=Nesidiocoris tenuis TaxID=355587 RepID=A0ABN7B6E5_9HEMI|nr:Hypothetical protein NTJ_11561 [Nesidiocoris tenuis]
MKCIALIVLFAAFAAYSSASPQFFSSITNAAKNTVNTANNVAKGTMNTANNLAKGTVNTATNAAKNTINTAQNAANQMVTAAQDVAKSVSSGALNVGVKFMLSQMKRFVNTMNLNTINLPDFNNKFGPVTVNATGGYFKDVSSITQSGDLSVDFKNTSMIIDFPVKISEVGVGYKNLTIAMWKMSAGAGIKVSVSNNTFIIRLRLKPGINCALNVEKVEVSVFQGIHVEFENVCSSCKWVLNNASDMIVGFMKKNIQTLVQKSVDDTLRQSLAANGPICSKFLG